MNNTYFFLKADMFLMGLPLKMYALPMPGILKVGPGGWFLGWKRTKESTRVRARHIPDRSQVPWASKRAITVSMVSLLKHVAVCQCSQIHSKSFVVEYDLKRHNLHMSAFYKCLIFSEIRAQILLSTQ